MKEIKKEIQELKNSVDDLKKCLLFNDDDESKEIIQKVFDEWQFPLKEVIFKVQEQGLTSSVIIKTLEKMRRSGDIFEPKRGVVQVIR